MTLTGACAIGALATTIVLLLLQLGRRSAGWDQAEVQKQLGELATQVQSFRDIRIADRLSRAESGIGNLRIELYDKFVLTKVCDERSAGTAREHDRDHPREN